MKNHTLLILYFLLSLALNGQADLEIIGDSIILKHPGLTKTIMMRTAGASGELKSLGDLYLRGQGNNVLINHALADGDVGIGTNAPEEKLDVDGAVKIGTTTNTNDGTLRYTGSDFEGYSGGAWMSFTGAGAASPWIDNANGIDYPAGRVGIGTNTPDEALDVNGALKLSNGSIGSDNGTIRYNGADLEGRVGGSWVSLTTGTSPWNTNGSDIYYDVVGNEVGIGTASPTSPFHVIATNTAGEVADITTSADLLGNSDVLNLSMGAGSADNAQFIECRRFVDLMFRVNGDGSVWAGIDKFRVVGSTGDVYITDPTAGVILTSPNGNCWRMTIDDSGVPSYTNVTCP